MACAALSVHARNFCIDSPAYDGARQHITMSITRIEGTGTGTDVYADFYGRPGWWFTVNPATVLEGKVSGKQYALTGIDGMTPGEKAYYPADCHYSTVLHFEPLADNDTIVDFIEPDGWQFSGLRLFDEPALPLRTEITGTLADHPDGEWVIIQESYLDQRINPLALVPVKDGKFSYILYTDAPRMFTVSPGLQLLDGSWHTETFISEGKPVHIEFPSGENLLGQVNGGPLTEELHAYDRGAYFSRYVRSAPEYKEYERLFGSGEAFSEDYHALEAEIAAAPDSLRGKLFEKMNELFTSGRAYSPAALQAQAAVDSLVAISSEHWKNEGLIHRGIPAMAELLLYSTNGDHLTDEALDLFDSLFADTITTHPYHSLLAAKSANRRPTPGRSYIDFSAPDLDGNMVTASNIINGKMAVITLWASWCGPCRQHSKELIPLYEKYRNDGFEVLGVARESVSPDAMKMAIGRDGYTWTNLIDLNDELGIWRKYGVDNAGGSIFLVNREGIVLAVNPSTEEIEAALKHELGH